MRAVSSERAGSRAGPWPRLPCGSWPAWFAAAQASRSQLLLGVGLDLSAYRIFAVATTTTPCAAPLRTAPWLPSECTRAQVRGDPPSLPSSSAAFPSLHYLSWKPMRASSLSHRQRRQQGTHPTVYRSNSLHTFTAANAHPAIEAVVFGHSRPYQAAGVIWDGEGSQAAQAHTKPIESGCHPRTPLTSRQNSPRSKAPRDQTPGTAMRKLLLATAQLLEKFTPKVGVHQKVCVRSSGVHVARTRRPLATLGLRQRNSRATDTTPTRRVAQPNIVSRSKANDVPLGLVRALRFPMPPHLSRPAACIPHTARTQRHGTSAAQ